MTLPVWPTGLPDKPKREGFQRAPRAAVIAFQTEVGPAKQRRRSTARTKLYTLSFDISTAQIATFETFFQTDLADGARPFTWTDPIDGLTARWRVDPGDPPYALTPLGGGWWNLSFRLEKLA